MLNFLHFRFSSVQCSDPLLAKENFKYIDYTDIPLLTQ